MLELIVKICIISVSSIGLPVLVIFLATKSYLAYITPLNNPLDIDNLRNNTRRAIIAAETAKSKNTSWFLESFSDYVVSITTYSIISKKYNARSGNNVLIYLAVLLIGPLPTFLCKHFFNNEIPTLICFLPSVVYYGLSVLLHFLFEKNISRFVSQYPADYSAAKRINIPFLSFEAPPEESIEYFQALDSVRQELELCSFHMKDRMEHATIARWILFLIFLFSFLFYKL